MTLTPEELYNKYQHYAERTLCEVFPDPHNLAKKKGIEYEDLVQYAKLGLWIGCLTYNPKKSKFNTHAINSIKWNLFKSLNKENGLIKLEEKRKYSESELYDVVSMDQQIFDDNEEKTLHELIASKDDTYKTGLGNVLINECLNRLTGFQKEILKLRLEEYTFEQIGSMYNMTKEAIRQHMKKMKVKFINLREVELV
ncbi:sigma-70 family RNA polymerase sigma factor [Heyndrickxia camelliae]|uniref:sigma-70 family RNA polymerase sigma factor n=1 Tax=Heyndrickxia camelliae TaxID=1707093 RepID=UPI0013FE28F3|nr:sigma-70 family RNA polymerase sigma factor [Heyndrickxia camelliae]